MPVADPSARRNEALITAVQQNNVKVVHYLLRRWEVDPSARDNEAIILASQLGFLGCAYELMQHDDVDASARNSEALRVAINRLRKKIEGNQRKPEILVSVRGVGYRMVGYISR